MLPEVFARIHSRIAGGSVPVGWSVVPLRQCLCFAPRYGINAPAVSFDDDLPTYLRITDISDDNRFKPSKRVSVRHENADKYYLSKGDIVFARTGSVGKSYLYEPSDGDLVFAGYLICVTPDPSKIEPRFLAYFAQSRHYSDWIEVTSSRSVQPGVNAYELGEMPILLPVMSEQQSIVEVLHGVDKSLNSLEVLIAKKRTIKHSTIQQLLSGIIQVQVLDKTRSIRKMEEFVSIRNSKVMPIEMSESTLCVELDDIRSGKGTLRSFSTARDANSIKYRFCPGDVLFGRLRPYLRKYWHANCTGICTTEIWPLVVDPKQADSRFLCAIVQSDEFCKAANISYGTHMPRADWHVMRDLKVRLPPIAEQQAIATVVSDMDAEIVTLEELCKKIRAIKHGMMQVLMTGRVRLALPNITSEEEQHL